jgi:hypothetical protein
LKIAKEKATDPQIIKKLDSFIEKIEQRLQQGEHPLCP